jgi:hypothetical protein
LPRTRMTRVPRHLQRNSTKYSHNSAARADLHSSKVALVLPQTLEPARASTQATIGNPGNLVKQGGLLVSRLHFILDVDNSTTGRFRAHNP